MTIAEVFTNVGLKYGFDEVQIKFSEPYFINERMYYKRDYHRISITLPISWKTMPDEQSEDKAEKFFRQIMAHVLGGSE